MTEPEAELSAPSAAIGQPKVLACPNCGGAVTLRAVGHSVNAACTQCGSLLDVAREEVRILKKAHEHGQRTLIPLGRRGRLEGIEWEVVGYQKRSSGNPLATRHFWDEYLLFNPRYGFRFLAEAEGHWTLYRVVKGGVGLPEGAKFERFFAGPVRVEYVLGEFYWRIRAGEEVEVADSIAPPWVLSVEKSRDESNPALGRYLAPEEVGKAFAIEEGLLPQPRGVAANQPSPFAHRVRRVLATTLLALVAATAIEFAQSSQAREELVHTESFEVKPAAPEKTQVSKPFTLPPGAANLCLETSAQLNNEWAELSISLVEEGTLEERNLLQGMEFYSGVEDGYHWAEGERFAGHCLSAVPGGRYRLVIEPDSNIFRTGGERSLSFTMRVLRDTPIWSNWVALLLLLLPYPLYLWYRHHNFEYARWSESDFLSEHFVVGEESGSSTDD